MRKASAVLAGILIAALGFGAVHTSTATASPATTSAVPMKVKITPFAGKRVKVAKRLKVLVTCSKDCAAKVKVKLITPAGNSTVTGGRDLTAEGTWITGMVLSNFGVKLLRNHWRNSRLKVSVTAQNVANGTIRKNSKTFRFVR
jgi:hypothetical protein